MTELTRVLVVQAEQAELAFQRSLFSEAGMARRSRRPAGAAALDFLATDRPGPGGAGAPACRTWTGLELLPRLKSNESGCRPVLVASRRGETAERVRGLQLGADDYISRPCDPAEFLARAKAAAPHQADARLASASCM